MSLSIKYRVRSGLSYSRIGVMRIAMLALLAALSMPSVYAQRANIRAGNGLKERRDSVLVFLLDTTKVRQEIRDSILANQSGTSRMVFVRESVSGRGLVDSSVAGNQTTYTINVGPSTIEYTGAVNYSNVSGNDSTHFTFNGVAFTGFVLPISTTYPVTFERFVYKTSVSGGTPEDRNFSSNICASNDSSSFSVHIDSEGSGGSRTYWLRIYKHQTSSYTGLSVPLTTGTLILSEQIDVALTRFPTHGTSVQIRLTIWIRRL